MTEQQEKEICARWRKGEPKTTLSREYHICDDTVTSILEKHKIEAIDGKKNRMKMDGTTKQKWDVVTAALRGDIPKSRMQEFCEGKISFCEAMRRKKST